MAARLREALTAMKQLLSNTKGQTLIFIALAFVVLGLFLGIAVDGGRAYLLRARLSKVVDAASLAGARNINLGIDEAIVAACVSVRVNGLDCAAIDGTVVTVVPVDTVTETCPSPTCVSVTASSTLSTSFMALGTLIGCSTCANITVVASGIAAPEQFLDLELLMDTSGTMNLPPPPEPTTRLDNVKIGAKKLLDTLISSDGPPSDNQIALVPFRGCYNGDPCVRIVAIVDLTSNNGELTTAIDGLTAVEVLGTGSGTNICHALDKGREKLSGAGSGSRPLAQKFLVLLTDGDHSPSTPVPEDPDCDTGGNTGDSDRNNLDREAFDRATALKDGDNVEIFVIDYGDTDPPDPENVNCGSDVGPTGINRNGDDRGDRILALCMASPGNYFPAPDPEDIEAAFEEIARRLGRLRLTG
ncbi:MAG: VWA domain-containing protein [Deltaproteobacteria bacterium]|nr:VWA domain-containing protein [Deltaproteobacteria bacterium]